MKTKNLSPQKCILPLQTVKSGYWPDSSNSS